MDLIIEHWEWFWEQRKSHRKARWKKPFARYMKKYSVK